MSEICKYCKQPRPPRNIESATNLYETFEEWLGDLGLSDGQIESMKNEAIAVLREAYDAGADLDNFAGKHGYEVAEACDTLALIKRLESQR